MRLDAPSVKISEAPMLPHITGTINIKHADHPHIGQLVDSKRVYRPSRGQCSYVLSGRAYPCLEHTTLNSIEQILAIQTRDFLQI